MGRRALGARARQIKQLPGCDRVMVYQFDRDGHSEVTSEAAEDRLDSLLGYHDPATDIPRQARAWYLRQAVIGGSQPWGAAEVDNAAELAESLAGRL